MHSSSSSRRVCRVFRPLLVELEGRVVPSFLPPVAYGTGREPNSVAVGEFNGDSVLDLAVANTNSADVSVLLGNGDGSFQKAQNFPAEDHPRMLVAGDFNADSFLDLAIANGGFSLNVLLGNGDGSFQPPLRSDAGTWSRSLAIGDFDGDGLLDLAVADGCYAGCESRVTVLLGNGDGTFWLRSLQPAGVGPRSLAVGDVNGDGFLDLAVAGHGGDCGEGCPQAPVRVLLGNGDGTLQPLQNLDCCSQSNAVVMEDFNADGLLDLAASFRADGGIGVYLGNGDGSFQPVVFTDLGSYGDLAVGDFNADGLLDLAIAHYVGETVAVLLGNGGGSFQAAQTFPAGRALLSVAVGDFDGNTFPDIAVTDRDSDAVVVLLNDGYWPGPDPAPGGSSPGSGLGPAAFDLLASGAPRGRRAVRAAAGLLPSTEPPRVPAETSSVRAAGSTLSAGSATPAPPRLLDHLFRELASSAAWERDPGWSDTRIDLQHKNGR